MSLLLWLTDYWCLVTGSSECKIQLVSCNFGHLQLYSSSFLRIHIQLAQCFSLNLSNCKISEINILITTSCEGLFFTTHLSFFCILCHSSLPMDTQSSEVLMLSLHFFSQSSFWPSSISLPTQVISILLIQFGVPSTQMNKKFSTCEKFCIAILQKCWRKTHNI